MSSWKRPRSITAPLVALVLVVSACGGDESGNEVATLETTATPDAPTTTTERLAADEALLEFSACMRENGIDLPDIAIGPDGAPLLDPSLVDDIDIQSDEFTAAFSACLPIIAASGAFQQTTDPEELAEQRDQLVSFSQCMRDEGIEGFPDPSLTGLTPYPISAFADFGEEDFDAAVEVCQEGIAFDSTD
jgi:hypothetical protein